MHRAAVNTAIRRHTQGRYSDRRAKHATTVFALRLLGVLCLIGLCAGLSAFHATRPEELVGVEETAFVRTSQLLSRPRDIRTGDHEINSLHAPECRQVTGARDQCAFVQRYCQGDDDGLISYFQLYYCTLSTTKTATWFILIPWTALLFTSIGICAGDFFAVNLSSLSRTLRLSDTLAGVTLLALGNGGPDIFSTWAAVTSNSPALAVGELVGAAAFITTVVAGSLALISPFHVRRVSLVRDAAFLLLTACILLASMVMQEFRLWQGILMVGVYIGYVLLVMIWHWWTPQKSDESANEERSDEEDTPTPTESQPLLQGPPSHVQSGGDAHKMAPAVYREIGEWRLAHGRCIMPKSEHNVQPSLLGSCEYLWRQKKQNSVKGPSPDTRQPTTPKPREHEGDDRVLSPLFPSLQDLSQRNVWHIVLNVATAVPFLLFKLTIPVVDNEHDTENCHHGWDRWLLLLQIFAAPQVIWTLVWLGKDHLQSPASWAVPAAYCLLASVLLGSVICIFSSPRRQPVWHPFLSILGFMMSAFWLSVIADEVVALMKFLGAISGLSQALLGYTVFAIGNSLDDWVADITVSRHGHPVMALAACFGGPLLNILFGLGTGIIYVSVRDANKTGKPVSIVVGLNYTLIISAAVVAVNMMVVVLVLRWNQWEMKRSFGVGLIIGWCLLTTLNIVLETVL